MCSRKLCVRLVRVLLTRRITAKNGFDTVSNDVGNANIAKSKNEEMHPHEKNFSN
jgi:hypothetical protein